MEVSRSYFHTFLNDVISLAPKLIVVSVFGLKFVGDLLARHVRPQNADGSYTVKVIPTRSVPGLAGGTVAVEKMWTDPIPEWMIRPTVNYKINKITSDS